MNVIIWLQEWDFRQLPSALNVIAQNYGGVNLIGMTAANVDALPPITLPDGKTMSSIDKHKLSEIDFDLIIVNGPNCAPAINEAKQLGLDTEKFFPIKAVLAYGFSIENFRRLLRSQLSIVAMGNWGRRLTDMLGVPPIAPSIEMPLSDRGFLNFLGDPIRNISRELRKNINWYNALFVMHTDNPKVLEEFDRLPIAKKVCLVPFETELDSGFYIKSDLIDYDLWQMMLHGLKVPVQIPAVPGQFHYASSDGKVQYYNWYPRSSNVDNSYLERVMRANNIENKGLNMFSVFGDHRFVRNTKLKRKVLWAMEELQVRPTFHDYHDYCLDSVDLAVGLEHLNAKNYLRFPGGLMGLFEAEIDIAEMERRIAEINAARSTCKYECVLINRHDRWNTRTPICNRLQDVLEIKYAGYYRHNTDELQTLYNNDKRKYVHEFRFNICSENTNRFGYVSEKIFDAFRAGAIPIYYGSDNRPEPGIINPSAVLFFDPQSNNEALVKEVVRLKTDQEYYDKFMQQEKIFPKPAIEYACFVLEELAKKLREIQQ